MADSINLQDEMALAIGQMTMAWSRAHFQMFDLLRFLTSHQDHPATKEFFAYANDDHKRKTILKIFRADFGKDHPLSVRLKAAIKKADDLSLKWNAFIHTPLWEIEDVEGIQPEEDWGSPNHRVYIIKPDALADCRDIHREIEEVEADIYDLIDDAIVAMLFRSQAGS